MVAARYERTGPATEVIEVGEVTTPEPGDGEVRVRLAFSGVNPTDWKSRAGTDPGPMVKGLLLEQALQALERLVGFAL